MVVEEEKREDGAQATETNLTPSHFASSHSTADAIVELVLPSALILRSLQTSGHLNVGR